MLSVLKDIKNGLICCKIVSGNISQTYHALSYTWGSHTDPQDILIYGQRLSVRRNLWEFLNIARQHYVETLFWIDAICINQDDVEERNQQIRIRGSIYKSARLTLIWLGPPDATNNPGGRTASTSEKQISLRDVDQHFEQFRGDLENVWHVPEQEIRNVDDVCESLELLGAYPYWSRMWVVQEMKLSRSKIVLFDYRQVRWSTLTQVFSELEWSQAEPYYQRTLSLWRK